MKDRYSVRYLTEEVRHVTHTVSLIHKGWWLYDWKEKKTVKVFPVGEHEQAEGLCKLLNSIEKEGA